MARKQVAGLFRPTIVGRIKNFAMDAKEDVMDVGLVGVGVAGGLAGSELAFQKIAMLGNLSPRMKGVAGVGLGLAVGIAAGYAASKTNQPDGGVAKGLGLGVAAGMTGWGIAKLAASFVEMPGAIAGLGEGSLAGSDTDLLLGLDVEDYRRVPGQISAGNVEAQALHQNPGGGYVSGIENNEVSEYQPIPGQMNGIGSFLQ